MSKNKQFKKYQPQPFESTGLGKYRDVNGTERVDTFARLYSSMLFSKIFMNMTERQKLLYLYIKSGFYGSRKPSKDYRENELFQGEEFIYFPWAEAQKTGLYKASMSGNFYRDLRVLIDNGFIERIASGKLAHKKTVYKFSSEWRNK